MASTIKKNQTAEIPTKSGRTYSYQYVDIAQIHEYLEEKNMSYYQYIDRIGEDDYIITVPIINGEEKEPRRGARVVDSSLYGSDNPAQKQGSALTYARRYSLLMAFGLATEDDDEQKLTRSVGTEKITKASPKQIEILSKVYTGENLEKLLKANNISKLEDLDIRKASAIIKALNEKKGN